MFTHKILKNALYCGLSLILLGALGACHPEDPDANLQVIHLSPDAPNLRVNDDSFLFADNFAYGRVSNLVDLLAGTHNVVIRGKLPNGNEPTLISLIDENFAETTNTIVVAFNTYDSIEDYVIVQDRIAIDSAASRVRIVHLASNTGAVDIYVTAPDADILNSTALSSLDFREEVSEVSLLDGEYQIRITDAGSQAVIFDSGLLTIAGGQELTILATDSTVNGDSPLELLYVEGSTSVFLRDQSTPSDVRLIHASPTASELDVAIIESENALTDVFTTPLLTDFSYGNSTPYLEFIPDSYNIKAVSAATSSPIIVEASPTFSFAANQSILLLDIEVLNADLVTTTLTTQTLNLSRDQRRITTDAKLELINTALNAGTVDVYLTTPGTDITTTDPVVTPYISNLALTDSTNLISSMPGSYDLIITQAGDPATVLTSALNITLVGGGIYTAIVIDDQITDADPDGLPASLLLLDDF